MIKLKNTFENIKSSFTDFDKETYKKYRNYFKAEYKIELTMNDISAFKKRIARQKDAISELKEKINKITLEKEASMEVLEKLYKDNIKEN